MPETRFCKLTKEAIMDEHKACGTGHGSYGELGKASKPCEKRTISHIQHQECAHQKRLEKMFRRHCQ